MNHFSLNLLIYLKIEFSILFHFKRKNRIFTQLQGNFRKILIHLKLSNFEDFPTIEPFKIDCSCRQSLVFNQKYAFEGHFLNLTDLPE